MVSGRGRPQAAVEEGLVCRCSMCGRLHLFLEPTKHPAVCHDCGSEEFGVAGSGSGFGSLSTDLGDVDPDEPRTTQ